MKILHISDPLGRHAELTNLPEDEDRTNFLIEIPCREEFNKKKDCKCTNFPRNSGKQSFCLFCVISDYHKLIA